MMNAARLLAPLLVASLLLAGCTQADPGPQEAPPGETAAPQATLGTILGTVTDDEGLPVAKATVTLAETLAETTTAADGSFGFTDLDPGRYTMIVDRIGYQDLGKAVEVAAGSPTEVEIRLTPIVTPDQAYALEFAVSGYMLFGWGLYDAFVTWDVVNATCDPCAVVAHYDADPVDVFVEPIWEKTIDTPATGETLYLWLDPIPDEGTRIWGKYVANREQHRFSEEELKMTQPGTSLLVQMGGGVTDVMVDQHVDVWMGFAYGSEFRSGYSPVPDEA